MSATPPSTRPYLIRALHEWCGDHGLTPHILVAVNDSVQVPREYVKDGSIVLNIGVEATTGLDLGNDVIRFKARFGGVARDIMVPVQRVVAIYARENGQGMAFPAEEGQAQGEPATASPTTAPAPVSPVRPHAVPSDEVAQGVDQGTSDAPTPPPRPGAGGRPALKRVK